MKNKELLFSILFLILYVGCESSQARKDRLAREEQQRIEIQKQRTADSIREVERRIERERQAEEQRLLREAELEKQRREQEIYNKYINNSLRTGATPYARYYGKNSSCKDYGCSEIKVITSNSDVLVLIKRRDKVVRHGYVRAQESYTFSFPNGTYQTFFYYGKGWNPNKEMKNGTMKGGFIEDEVFGKDKPQRIYNSRLTYELILQQHGNFETKPSDEDEAL